jgi:hypothetical protein
MVARHLNTSVHYIRYHTLDKTLGDNSIVTQMGSELHATRPTMHSLEKIKRCEFIPLEFMDDDIGLGSDKIIEVVRK